ncbi:MAG: selenocysteine-specific translation elongation factor [Planctomycetota bacterium]|jgi:selenocysteine-specific elongation factor
MSAAQVNITLGTAGHIDHGKTALVKCLTGCDTDHLKAEKERGMSIDLGFAPCTISDMEVGIVDVPGHENFIKTMVAGASGIDGVIFVIAADDGVMPQTREHLDILTLLGVKHGIVALTKADCVDGGRLEVVAAEVKDFLAGTFLQDALILPVSSITGQGFDAFYEVLKALVGAIEPKTVDGVFRLPVERTFSLKGYGTVVTGIPVSGRARIGDEVVLYPQGTKGRIKAIQVYKRGSDTAMSGQCAAINVPQWDHKAITRGNVISQPGYFSPQQWYLCRLSLLASAGAGLKNGTEVKFHTGTSEVVAAVYLMAGSTAAAGQECLIQVRLHEPVVAGPGDRFILRRPSPAQTIGGGVVVEAVPKKLKRSQEGVIEDTRARAGAVLLQKDFVEYCIKTAKALAGSEAEISFRAKLPPASLKTILGELVGEGKVLNLTSKLYIHTETAAAAERRLLDVVGGFHRDRPESPGMRAEQLFASSALEKAVFDGLIGLLISRGKLAERKHRLALPDHRESLGDKETQLLEAIESLFSTRLFNPPNCDEVVQLCSAGKDKVERVLKILIEYERLVRVENDLLFHCNAVDRARDILVSYLNKEGKLESVKFKYLLDTTRKYAIPLLDYMDRIGVTRRLGNTRYLKTPANSG